MLQGQPAYVSPVHTVERVRVRARTHRSRPNFAVLYGIAGIAGIATGLFLSVIA